MAQYVVCAPSEDDETVVDFWVRKYSTAINELLAKHELLKVKVREAGKRRRAERLGIALAAHVDAQLAQSIGHTVLLYRALPDGTGIELPAAPAGTGEEDA